MADGAAAARRVRRGVAPLRAGLEDVGRESRPHQLGAHRALGVVVDAGREVGGGRGRPLAGGRGKLELGRQRAAGLQVAQPLEAGAVLRPLGQLGVQPMREADPRDGPARGLGVALPGRRVPRRAGVRGWVYTLLFSSLLW